MHIWFGWGCGPGVFFQLMDYFISTYQKKDCYAIGHFMVVNKSGYTKNKDLNWCKQFYKRMSMTSISTNKKDVRHWIGIMDTTQRLSLTIEEETWVSQILNHYYESDDVAHDNHELDQSISANTQLSLF